MVQRALLGVAYTTQATLEQVVAGVRRKDVYAIDADQPFGRLKLEVCLQFVLDPRTVSSDKGISHTPSRRRMLRSLSS
jgi:hypothetical protein